MFKNELSFNKENRDQSYLNNKTLVSCVNQTCSNCSHEHRKSTKDEYANNKLYRLTKTGCYLCNPKINFDSYLVSLSWTCNCFNYIVKHRLSLEQKLVFLMITNNLESKFFLPLEMILMIFRKAEWNEKKNKIDRVTNELVTHSKSCRICAEKLVSNNTGFTCSHHIIPRAPSNIDEFAYGLNYGNMQLNY